MGLREVPSDVGQGSSAGAVADAWRRHERDRYANAGQRNGRLLAEAEAWLSRFPEFIASDGLPCYVAIQALLWLRSQHGPGQVTRDMVRAGWLSNLARRPEMAWYVAEFLPHVDLDDREDR